MSFPEVSVRARRRLVWIVPVIVSGIVVLVATMTGASSADTPKLRSMTAKQLIAAVERTTTTAFSGTIDETTNLGLPSLPGGSREASLSWQTFLSGTHSVRVWVDGAARQRLALVGELSEAEVVHNGRDVWTYTSHTNTASHTVLPVRPSGSTAGHSGRDGKDSKDATDATEPTPAAVADQLLKAVTPTTKVGVATPRTIAGRPAYVLSIVPRDARSTVRKATIAIDARRFIPLRVQIFGRDSSPALSIGFSDISFTRPAHDVFAFHVPKGATIESDPLTSAGNRGEIHRTRAHSVNGRTAAPRTAHAAVKPTLIGSGWTSVLEVHDLPGLGGGMLQDATTSLAGGGRLLHTALLNVVFLPDGRTFIGAVTPAAIEHVAATTPR